MHMIESQTAASGSMEFLAFQLGGREYGVDFGKVRELRSLGSMDRFAADGAIVPGVAASRGVIMPIVDMREAFHSKGPRGGFRTDVIVLQLATSVIGMVVDGVTDVVRVNLEEIAPIPGPAGAAPCDYLLGMGHSETTQRRLILLDIDKLMSIRRDAQAAVA
jgi:purine-binding chemotaxis protein CheW